MQTLTLKILPQDEFEKISRSDPRYQNVGPYTMGFADPDKGRIFVRQTYWPELNSYLLHHELEHLLEEEGTDEDEFGIRHKAIFAALPALAGGALKGIGAGLGGVLGGLGSGIGSALSGITGALGGFSGLGGGLSGISRFAPSLAGFTKGPAGLVAGLAPKGIGGGIGGLGSALGGVLGAPLNILQGLGRGLGGFFGGGLGSVNSPAANLLNPASRALATRAIGPPSIFSGGSNSIFSAPASRAASFGANLAGKFPTAALQGPISQFGSGVGRFFNSFFGGAPQISTQGATGLPVTPPTTLPGNTFGVSRSFDVSPSFATHILPANSLASLQGGLTGQTPSLFVRGGQTAIPFQGQPFNYPYIPSGAPGVLNAPFGSGLTGALQTGGGFGFNLSSPQGIIDAIKKLQELRGTFGGLLGGGGGGGGGGQSGGGGGGGGTALSPEEEQLRQTLLARSAATPVGQAAAQRAVELLSGSQTNLPPGLLASVSAPFDRLEQEIITQFKQQFREGADPLTDSGLRQALLDVRQRKAEAVAQAEFGFRDQLIRAGNLGAGIEQGALGTLADSGVNRTELLNAFGGLGGSGPLSNFLLSNF